MGKNRKKGFEKSYLKECLMPWHRVIVNRFGTEKKR